MNHKQYAQVLGDFFLEHGYTVAYAKHNIETLTRFYVGKYEGRRSWPDKVEVLVRDDEVTLPAYPPIPQARVWRQMTNARGELAELLDKHLSNGFTERGFQLVKQRGSGAPPFKAKPLKAQRKTAVRADRVRINAQGYDGGGRYWGTGAPLFFVYETESPADGENLRAASAKVARAEFKKKRRLEGFRRGAHESAAAYMRGA